MIYGGNGEFEKAISVLEEAQLLHSKHHAENISLENSIYSSFAHTYNNLKQYEKALEYQKLVVQNLGKSLGYKNAMYIMEKANLANVYYHVRETEKAKEILLDLIDGLDDFAINDREKIGIYYVMFQICSRQNEPSDAIKYGSEMWSILMSNPTADLYNEKVSTGISLTRQILRHLTEEPELMPSKSAGLKETATSILEELSHEQHHADEKVAKTIEGLRAELKSYAAEGIKKPK